MTAAWYAVVDHVGSIHDLAGQEVTIALVRRMDVTMSRTTYEIKRTMDTLASGRAWCRVMPTGSQVPTRGGMMRVYSGCHQDGPLARERRASGPGSPDAPWAQMLSAEQLIERLRRDLETEREALRLVTGERDHLRGEVQRWRERAADRDGLGMGVEQVIRGTCARCQRPYLTCATAPCWISGAGRPTADSGQPLEDWP
jgi:hypothetical protein